MDPVSLTIREYRHDVDRRLVEEVERICEVGPSGKLSLYTDLLGDPLCRVRNSPSFLMLVIHPSPSHSLVPFFFPSSFFIPTIDLPLRIKQVAETETGAGEEVREIVGMVRGCVKTVTCGKRLSRQGKHGHGLLRHVPVYTKVGYILGLRVSPHHRRKGIASRLVGAMETWLIQNGADYSYIATENDNAPSVALFTRRCGYSKFRTPALLVNPVHAHDLRIPSRRLSVIRLRVPDASLLYRERLSTTEFFPRDIDAVLSNPLSLGTFLAVPRGYAPSWDGILSFLADPPESWAVLSVWNCKDSFRLEVKGASRLVRVLVSAGRALDRALPFLGLPSFPEIFRPFGGHFVYGLGGEGPDAAGMVRALFRVTHNLARRHGCEVVATEVARGDPLREGIPHWKRLSCPEDLWCVKRLGEDYSDGAIGDWTKSPPGLSIFVDPREV
ncbi:hypothetical protein MLD38_030287 [Melastoma candidum]|uniref:Uncharacterized protein n=1 Tax=Melastoma candidum TaxID=119954 RepID=A0ACB9MKY7_9MYRT|nr:hypothetical protein MLD38_030287 [Melastoma candidum]